MPTRMTVAQLAEQTNEQIAALQSAVATIAEALTATPAEAVGQPAMVEADDQPFGFAEEDEVHEAASLTQLVEDEAEVATVEGFALKLKRQATKSKGGSLRFWSGSDPEGPQASVYINGVDDYAAKKLALQVTSTENGSAVLRQVTTASGSAKATKGRLSWEGKFTYGGGTIQVFVNVPKAAAKLLPAEIGLNLAL